MERGRCQGDRGIPQRLWREDMPRKPLDIRPSDHPIVWKTAPCDSRPPPGCRTEPLTAAVPSGSDRPGARPGKILPTQSMKIKK